MRKVFFSIILPAFFAILLFIVAIYAVIIPSFEKNMMERKKEMTAELVQTVWSLVKSAEESYNQGLYTLEEAQKVAIQAIENMRYGEEQKDYFWLTDMRPVMLMHPYRTDLNGRELSEYADPHGKKLFMEAVRIVQESGEGYIDYFWQWKDDPGRVVPKLSYVKAFEPWGWILGTGIYLEDVKHEIRLLERNLLRVSALISIVILVILVFIVRQSLRIEHGRKVAEEKLQLSRLKYKTLVEASTEGTLMLVDGNVIFANQKFRHLARFSETETIPEAGKLFDFNWQEVTGSIVQPDKSYSSEARLICGNGEKKDVVVSVSRVRYAASEGYILMVKEMDMAARMRAESRSLENALQTSLLLMNRSVAPFVRPLVVCHKDNSLFEAAKLMTRKKQGIVYITDGKEIIGSLSDRDISSRAVAGAADPSARVTRFMTAPVADISSDALLSEAAIRFREFSVSDLAVRDPGGEITGFITENEVFEPGHNLVSQVITMAEKAESAEELKQVYMRVPVIARGLLDSGGNAGNLTGFFSLVTDAIIRRVTGLALAEMGEPPCPYSLICLGSEGRQEPSLHTDQDNAIILGNPQAVPGSPEHDWFAALARKINGDLDTAGFHFCRGEVMAMNPRWMVPYDEWVGYFREWILKGDPASLMEVSIFFDFRHLTGNNVLAEDLKKEVLELARNQSAFFHHLAQSVLKFKPPVGLLGHITTEHNHEGEYIDVKKILHPITAFARVYALKNGITETNTLRRLELLGRSNIIPVSLADEVARSYNFLMVLRIRSQADRIFSGQTADNRILPETLDEFDRILLKKVFAIIQDLHLRVQDDFGPGPQ